MRNVVKSEKPSSKSSLGEKIKYVRTKSLMSQEVFAKKIGRQRPEVAMYESGTRTPDIYTLKEIAIQCNVSVDYLLGINNVETSNIKVNDINKLTGLSEKAVNNLIILNKTFNGYLIPTINYLIEQEEFDDYNSNTNLENIQNADISRIYDVIMELKDKQINSHRIISKINNYLNASIKKDSNAILHITNNGLKKVDEFNSDYEKVLFTNETIFSQDIIDNVLISHINDELKQAKQDYQNYKED